MDRREIKNVEAHLPDVGQAADHIVERAVAIDVAGLRARKQLVPACERGLRPLDVERDRRMLHAKRALGGRRDGFRRRRRGQHMQAGFGIAALQRADRLAQRRGVAGHGFRVDGFEIFPRLDQLERDVDAGFVLDLDLVTERRVIVAPGLDGEEMAADALSAGTRPASDRCRDGSAVRASSPSRRRPSRAAPPP